MLYVTFTLNFLLMLSMPFILAEFLARRLGTRWGLIWVGAVTFIGSQIVHIPLNALLARLGLLTAAKAGWPLVWLAAELGLLAGLCEELARYLVLRFWLKRDRSWRSALMFGAGHGGAEAVIVGLITASGAINLFVLRNVDPARLGLAPDQVAAVQAQVAQAFSYPVLYPLLGAYERVLALCTHLLLAVLVMRAFTHSNPLWLLAAIVWHALVDGVAVYVSQTVGAIPTEAAITVLAIIAGILIFVLREPEPAAVPAEAPLPPPATAPLLELPATLSSEQLDRSKYQ